MCTASHVSTVVIYSSSRWC